MISKCETYASLPPDERLKILEQSTKALEKFDPEFMFKSVFSWIPMGVLILKHNGDIMRLNNAACDILECLHSKEDKQFIRDIGLFSLIHPDELETECKLLGQIEMGNAVAYDITKRIRTANRTWKWVDSHVRAPYPNRYSELICFLTPAIDPILKFNKITQW